jgi:hypothetical protein
MGEGPVTLRLGLVSDLHVDVRDQPPISLPECDVLLISGDVGNSLGAVQKFLSRASRRTEIPLILHVDGNHEHYSNAPQGRTVRATQERLTSLMPPRCAYLPALGSAALAPRVYAVGVCGWYCFELYDEPREKARERWREQMNDDYWIGFTDMSDDPQPWDLARADAAHVRGQMELRLQEDPEARFVISTHTVPHRELLHKAPMFLSTNPFYVNTHMEAVAEEFSDRIILWTYGHTHFRGDRTLENGVRYLANPRGYPDENPSWKPHVEEID